MLKASHYGPSLLARADELPVLGIDLSGKLAVVTGAASGIGEAVADAFEACGARLVALDRVYPDEPSRQGRREQRYLDVCDAKLVAAVFDGIEAELGAIDLLVNSAGILQRPIGMERASDREWDRVIATNLRGTYQCCRQAGNRMAERRRGAIVNVASVTGLRSSPLHAYGPSKAAIINLTEGLAAEWGRRGVRVNAVAPGFTWTPAIAEATDARYVSREQMSQASAAGRLVHAAEVAQAIAFLASDLASAITGVTLPVDCGYLVASPWTPYGAVPAPTQG